MKSRGFLSELQILKTWCDYRRRRLRKIGRERSYPNTQKLSRQWKSRSRANDNLLPEGFDFAEITEEKESNRRIRDNISHLERFGTKEGDRKPIQSRSFFRRRCLA